MSVLFVRCGGFGDKEKIEIFYTLILLSILKGLTKMSRRTVFFFCFRIIIFTGRKSSKLYKHLLYNLSTPSPQK